MHLVSQGTSLDPPELFTYYYCCIETSAATFPHSTMITYLPLSVCVLSAASQPCIRRSCAINKYFAASVCFTEQSPVAASESVLQASSEGRSAPAPCTLPVSCFSKEVICEFFGRDALLSDLHCIAVTFSCPEPSRMLISPSQLVALYSMG